MSEERDTHFRGYADLFFPELSRLFFTLYARIEEQRPIEEIDAVEDEIKALLAQRGYDLVYHTLDQADLDQDFYGRDEFEYDPHKIVKSIPDLTAWPEQEEKS